MDFKNLLKESLIDLNDAEFIYFKSNLQIILPFVKIKKSILDLTILELIDLLWINLKECSFKYVLSTLKTSGFIQRYNLLNKNLTDILFCTE
ncbi:hypothetical protein LDVICp128 [lymphocystis disease virus-China]|uniref:Uncharacterized protein n=2 Tax=Lymphocystis disease virus 2 TaxID=159183 RepID=A0A6F8X166_9VIRU|nr:hypothetical protein LDVICp128 [lymphocystis disease virus-China]AAU10973.1 hypothetical protein [lymphocystis disease virus-China]BCB67485.1 hypothetical protein [Lymphocystis disease virus 2]